MLIKFIFVNKTNKNNLTDEGCDYVVFQYALFKKEDSEYAIKWLKANAFVPENTTFAIHGTGVGFPSHNERIESIFGIKVVFVNEDLSISVGHRMALEQIGEDHLKSPHIGPNDMYRCEGGIMKMFKDGMDRTFHGKYQKATEKPSSIFPCLLYVCDFSSKFYYFDDNGLMVPLSVLGNIGKTFFGMAKCILDTNNYEEIVELAKDGNRCNIDTLIKDILGAALTEYGSFSIEMPIFPFGQVGEQINQLKEFSRNDLAMSLIGLFASLIYDICYPICGRTNVTKIYFYGYIFQSKIFQGELENIKVFLPVYLDYIYLELEYCAALGSIFCSNEEKEKYIK